MKSSSNSLASAGTTQTYLPATVSQDEFHAFATSMHEIARTQATEMPVLSMAFPDGRTLPIPQEILRILEHVTNALSSGQGVTVMPQDMTMTTQQAAEFLGVSRPTVVRLLESGEIPFRQPGRHRRVQLSDLVAYQERTRRERSVALHDMRRSSIELQRIVEAPIEIKRLSELDDE